MGSFRGAFQGLRHTKMIFQSETCKHIFSNGQTDDQVLFFKSWKQKKRDFFFQKFKETWKKIVFGFFFVQEFFQQNLLLQDFFL